MKESKLATEINRENAVKLSRLILENPKMRVIAWIDSDGISDEYSYWAGNIGNVEIETIAYSEIEERYIVKNMNAFENCMAYYGNDAEYWTDEALEEKSKEIPWEDVIAVNVSAV